MAEAKRLVNKMYSVMCGTSKVQSCLGETSLNGLDGTEPGCDALPSSARVQQESGSSCSAGPRREPFGHAEEVVVDKEARRLMFSGISVSTAITLAFMARHRPLFDERSPKVMANKLRDRPVTKIPYRRNRAKGYRF